MRVISIGRRLLQPRESLPSRGSVSRLVVLFRQKWNRQGRLAKGLAANPCTIFLLHPPVIASIVSAFSTVALYPLVLATWVN